jgi:hypothetical protein
MSLIDFGVKRLKIKGQTKHTNILFAQYLENFVIDRHKIGHTGIS